MKSSVDSYSLGSKIIHWLSAFIVICMLSLSFFLSDVPDPYKPTAYMMHKSFGLTVLLLIVLRIVWLIRHGRPDLPTSVARWQKRLARSVQITLYALLFAMPMSGLIMSVAAKKPPTFFGLFYVSLPIEPNQSLAKFMSEIHTLIAWALIALILLHLLGVLKHYFIDKDRVLHSMLPKSKS